MKWHLKNKREHTVLRLFWAYDFVITTFHRMWFCVGCVPHGEVVQRLQEGQEDCEKAETQLTPGVWTTASPGPQLRRPRAHPMRSGGQEQWSPPAPGSGRALWDSAQTEGSRRHEGQDCRGQVKVKSEVKKQESRGQGEEQVEGRKLRQRFAPWLQNRFVNFKTYKWGRK